MFIGRKQREEKERDKMSKVIKTTQPEKIKIERMNAINFHNSRCFSLIVNNYQEVSLEVYTDGMSKIEVYDLIKQEVVHSETKVNTIPSAWIYKRAGAFKALEIIKNFSGIVN